MIVPAVASAWAPASSATIHPGVQTFTAGAQCTSNFVFSDGTNTYIGQAAHCSGTGGNTATDGCTSGTLPVGTQVDVTGASKPGTMVYNSWATMQANGESNADTCAYNDLALIKLDPSDVANVNPSVPGYGGPTGVGTVGSLGDKVYSYGNSELRGGVTKLSPKEGVLIQNQGNGWSHNVFTVSPGIPGDSGSGFMNALRPGDRHPVHAAARPGRRLERRRRHRQGDRLPAREQLLLGSEPRAGNRAVQAGPGRRDPGGVVAARANGSK